MNKSNNISISDYSLKRFIIKTLKLEPTLVSYRLINNLLFVTKRPYF